MTLGVGSQHSIGNVQFYLPESREVLAEAAELYLAREHAARLAVAEWPPADAEGEPLNSQ